VLDGGDPLERLEQFAVAGEVAVVDLDAALGRGSNAATIRRMVRRAACRVGGGIRDLDSARAWLDAGAERIVIGTAASPAFCGALPRDRVIAAVDSARGEVVVDGWRAKTGQPALDVIRSLAPHVGGFLLTQVEREGEMEGFDATLVRAAVAAAGNARVTAAGGISSADEIAELDRLGADAQVGMALYTERINLGDAVAAVLRARPDGLWPTVVCDESGRVLGLVWSSAASLRRAVAERRGIYWSRSRSAIWVKGESSGNTQRLLAVDADCDRDALRFVVRQEGTGFCHRSTRSCFRDRFDLGTLERVIAARRTEGDPESGTVRLLTRRGLLESKLAEETAELARAATRDEVVHEAADVLYLVLAAIARAGATLADVESELGRRRLAVRRRPMEAK
jgi:phosphoribosyl-ATP pyrophosphohydrolase